MTDQELPFDDESIVPLDQQETEDDINPERSRINDAVLFNTDWTVETLFRQIDKGNINLDPQFQRREAWNVERKSKFIESILCNLPIPNVVLAEDKGTKGRYLVLDGKQRLYSISSFLRGEFLLKGLAIRGDLNGLSFPMIEEQHPNDVSTIENYPIRTVIIRNWPDEDYLYTVFYRLNSGSLPLSPQELRKALHGGKLLDFLDGFIRSSDEFKAIFGEKLDPRMRDVELVLRFVAFDRFYTKYKGDLKAFLDDTVKHFDREWDNNQSALNDSLSGLTIALQTTATIFEVDAFKKWNGAAYERRINRAIFDVMTRYFSDRAVSLRAIDKKDAVVAAFQLLCVENDTFRNAIERTTKTPAATHARHALWGEQLGAVIGATLDKKSMRLF